MSLTMIVTNAGRAALVNATNTGTAPITIASCGISATAVVPTVAATNLPGELYRFTTVSGDVVADDTIHLIVRDEGAGVYTLRSFALYLADGTLFAIYGQSTPVLEKSAQSIMLLALDVRFADVAATSLTFGNANFLNPPATPDQIGVVELATLAEQLAGTDDRRVAAAKTIKDAVFSWLDARFGANNASIWHPGNDGAGSGLDADLLDGQQGSYYSNIPARLGFTPANRAGEGFTGPIGATAYNLSPISNSGLYISGGNPIFGMDLGDYLFYDRAANRYGFAIANDTQMAITEYGFVSSRTGFSANGNIVWHAGNDGAGSGSDADLLDGQQGSYYSDIAGRLGFVPANRAGDTFGGRVTFAGGGTGNSDLGVATGGLGEIEVRGNGVGAAMMTFHRPGSFAGYLGVAIDNNLRWGGWSLGAVGHLMWHSGNDGAGSGLDADLLDGQDGSFYGNIPARLGFMPANRAGDTFTGDITTYRAGAANQGVVFLGNSGGRYLYYDGANYNLPGAELYGNGGGRMWHSLNDGSGSGLDADLLDGRHASDFALAGGFTSGSNSNGYWCRRPDGVIEQWGRYPTSGGENFYTVPFPIPFTVAGSISISATAILRNSVDDVWPSISGAPTVENFTVLQNAIGSSELTNGFHWRAIGV